MPNASGTSDSTWLAIPLNQQASDQRWASMVSTTALMQPICA